MAKSFFLNSKGEWRSESKRATLFWFLIILCAYKGASLGSQTNPLGTLLGLTAGFYLGLGLHHMICQTVFHAQIKPIEVKVGAKTHMKGLYKRAKAAANALCEGNDVSDAIQEAKEDHYLAEKSPVVLFIKGMAQQVHLVQKEMLEYLNAVKKRL